MQIRYGIWHDTSGTLVGAYSDQIVAQLYCDGLNQTAETRNNPEPSYYVDELSDENPT